MKNAQKIIRRDPDLMTVMQININDSDITAQQSQQDKTKKDEPKKNLAKPEPVKPSEPPKKADTKKKGGYGNLFG